MADAMVTARMSAEKKEAGNRILERLGTNSSQVVNRLYDYVLEKEELPFPEKPKRGRCTKEEVAEAIAWVDGIPRKRTTGRFSDMTVKEAKRDRLIADGLMQQGDNR